MPDIVANVRLDQAWGSAQAMAALHQVPASYYGATVATGHPSDAYGWAVGGGVKVLAPMIGKGDYFQAEVNYSQGARKYVDASYTNMYSLFNGSSYGIGIGSDAVFNGTTITNGTSLQLTTAWGVNAAYEHFWNRSWQTSVYGAYTATTYNASANTSLCTAETSGGGAQGFGAAFALNGAVCNNNFQTWNIGSRTQFNLDANTYLGVDVVYEKLQSGLKGMNALYGNGVTSASTGPRLVTDQSAWMAQFRVHRNFYP
jgi:hypothetical protein